MKFTLQAVVAVVCLLLTTSKIFISASPVEVEGVEEGDPTIPRALSCQSDEAIVHLKKKNKNKNKNKKRTCARIKSKGWCDKEVKDQGGKTAVDFCTICGCVDPLDKSPEVVQKDPTKVENDPNELDPDDIQHIVGGDSSDDGEFPYYVLMASGCGGSLIAPRVVLTAAHCHPENHIGREVTVGPTDRGSLENGEFQQARTIRSKKAILHPNYNPAAYWDNDVALVLLEEEYVIDSSIELVLNYDSNFPPDGDVLDVLGMGKDSSGWCTEVLKDVKAESLSNSQCSLNFSMVTENMMCAEIEEGRTWSGDSGGPLVKIVGNTHTQVGVVSFGAYAKRGDANLHLDFPNVYARVSEQFDWIKNQICNVWDVESSLCGPTTQPTTAPTTSPAPTTTTPPSSATTESPTEYCANREDYLWNGQKNKNCEWVSRAMRRRCIKAERILGKDVAFHCRSTCARVGVGPCKHLSHNGKFS